MRFVLGFVIGTTLGFIFAPAPGSETRSQLKNKVRELARYPETKIEEKAREVAAGAEEKAGDVGSRIGRVAAKAAVKAVADEMLDKNDKQTA